MQAQKGRLRFWVRNLVRREGNSFFLQKADGRFNPDFLCRLLSAEEMPGPVVAVAYKGANRWADAAHDRLIGSLCAGLSEDRCRFVMIKDQRWDDLEPLLALPDHGKRLRSMNPRQHAMASFASSLDGFR